MTEAEAADMMARRTAVQQQLNQVMSEYLKASGSAKEALKPRVHELQQELATFKPMLRAWGDQCHEADQAGVQRSKRELVGRLLQWRQELRDRSRNPKAPPAERHFADAAAKRLVHILGPLQKDAAPTSSSQQHDAAPRSDPQSKPDRHSQEATQSEAPGLVVPYKTVWGGSEITLTTEEAREYARDPMGTMCRKLGVTEAEFSAWQASAGHVSCSAMTVAGRRCKQLVKGSPTLSLREWVDRMKAGERCETHKER
ncbi:MAG TPA: hypothetical protein VEZ12_21615 [Herpetosiphonaceae bacterium]|nr:hypothetical protein [Herpetosiphonaceae bacterium]